MAVWPEAIEDKWIPSACNMCYNGCSIKGRIVDGVLVKIEGNENSPIGSGKMCPKGQAGPMMLYDPSRVNVPLKRTNPVKGKGIDPGWKEITWEEAIEEVSAKLKEVYEDDPRKLFYQGTTTCHSVLLGLPIAFQNAFGTPNMFVAGGGLHCGNAAHTLNGVFHASWSVVPDFDYCNYSLFFGCSKGHSAGHVGNANAQLAADARSRGMKLVVVDPINNFAAAKSTEWVSIIPGTDAALALTMVNLLVNEYGMYDKEYLTKCTNGPYLIGADGYYIRDEATDKPLIFDLADNQAKPFDDQSVKEMALEGAYKIGDSEYSTAFELLKNSIKKHTPEKTEKISGVPAKTIRRLAKEFGTEAKIGSTITIEGKILPYRPAAAIYFRGVQGHKNAVYNCMAVELLNQVVGCADVVGGALGFNPVCYGHPESGRPYYKPTADKDGLMITGAWVVPHKPYPPTEPTKPQTMGLIDMLTFAAMSPFMVSKDQEELWQKIDLPYRPEVGINFGANSVMSVGNSDTTAEALKKLKFMISFDIYLNETTDFADIILPDTCYMERYDAGPQDPFIFNHPAGMGTWGWPIRQPMVDQIGERRDIQQVLMDIAEKIGIRRDVNAFLNLKFDIREPYKLELDKNYSWEEICDRRLKSLFGEERGLEWFKENGVLTWPKKVEEVYWRHELPVRVPIYLEFLKHVGEKAKKIADECGINGIDWAMYEPIPDYFPCISHLVEDEEFDVYGFYYRHVLHTNSLTMQNPWLDEQSHKFPGTYDITINRQTAEKKNIKDGDYIWLVSTKGRRVKGKARLFDGVHPQCVAMAANAGHWTKFQPIAYGKGVFFNDLLEVDLEHSDPVTLCLDLCVKLKIEKV